MSCAGLAGFVSLPLLARDGNANRLNSSELRVSQLHVIMPNTLDSVFDRYWASPDDAAALVLLALARRN